VWPRRQTNGYRRARRGPATSALGMGLPVACRITGPVQGAAAHALGTHVLVLARQLQTPPVPVLQLSPRRPQAIGLSPELMYLVAAAAPVAATVWQETVQLSPLPSLSCLGCARSPRVEVLLAICQVHPRLT
jgi:hypothetical protein